MPARYAVSPGKAVFVANNKTDSISVRGVRFGKRSIDEHPGPGEFTSLDGLAVSRKHVFVCDFLNSRVQVFRHNGSWVRMLDYMFDYPTQVEVLEQDVLVRDTCQSDLYVFDGAGPLRRKVLAGPCDKFAVGAEELFVFEYPSGIRVFSFEGVLLRQIAADISELLVGVVRDFLLVVRFGDHVVLRPDGSVVFRFKERSEAYAVGPDATFAVRETRLREETELAARIDKRNN
jgi:hypothetical protein